MGRVHGRDAALGSKKDHQLRGIWHQPADTTKEEPRPTNLETSRTLQVTLPPSHMLGPGAGSPLNLAPNTGWGGPLGRSQTQRPSAGEDSERPGDLDQCHPGTNRTRLFFMPLDAEVSKRHLEIHVHGAFLNGLFFFGRHFCCVV